MRILLFDAECTFKKATGHFGDLRDKLVCIAWGVIGESRHCVLPEPASLSRLQEEIDKADLIIGFNIKYDIHWLRRYGVYVPFNKRIWDVQIAEYILRYQRDKYLSLQQTCEGHDIPGKLDVVKLEYWDKGIDTDAIPFDVLSKYAVQDIAATEQCYFKQLELLDEARQRLVIYSGKDLLVLQEMEWNGLIYDPELCKQRAKECETRIVSIQGLLQQVYPDIPINFGSPQQLSAFLYGGIIEEEYKEHVGFFKSGIKAGQPKYANRLREHILPRLVEPLPKSEMAKKGVFSTAEDTLLKLRGTAAKKYVAPLLELSKQEKLLQTYYRGIPKINEEHRWRDSTIHGTINQATTITGRTSATQPNQQNFAGECQDIFITRYDT